MDQQSTVLACPRLDSSQRHRRRGEYLHHKDHAAILTAPAAQSVLVDPRRMAVQVIFTTESPDRSRDVVVTRGIRTVNHIKNPVVFYDHGLSGLTLPIGKAEDPDRNYTVRLEDGYGVGTTFFSQQLAEAEQVFRLIDEGILRGASIGFDPIRLRPLPISPEDVAIGRESGGMRIEECELIEYSHVPVPDNQDALTVAVEKRRIGSTRLSPLMVKSLLPFLPEPKAQVVSGWTPPAKARGWQRLEGGLRLRKPAS